MAKRSIFNPHDAFLISVAAGYIQGFSSAAITAAKLSVAIGAQRDMFLFTDTYEFPPDDGVAMEMVSDDVADTGKEFTIVGLDSEGFRKTEAHITNGTTPVSIGVWSAINAMTNTGATSHAGGINIRNVSVPATIYARSELDQQRAIQGAYVMPCNASGMVLGLILAMQKALGSDVGGIIRAFFLLPGSTARVFAFAAGLQKTGDTSPEFPNPLPTKFPPRTKLIFTVEALAAGADFLARAPVLLIDE